MNQRRLALATSIIALVASVAWHVHAQSGPANTASAPAASSNEAELPLFAVEIKIGPKWDSTKPPPEQAFFREHSANLRRLREAGHIKLGARFGDKGLIVLAAASIDEARAWMNADSAMQHGTFSFELHPFAVFYGGSVSPARRR